MVFRSLYFVLPFPFLGDFSKSYHGLSDYDVCRKTGFHYHGIFRSMTCLFEISIHVIMFQPTLHALGYIHLQWNHTKQCSDLHGCPISIFVQCISPERFCQTRQIHTSSAQHKAFVATCISKSDRTPTYHKCQYFAQHTTYH